MNGSIPPTFRRSPGRDHSTGRESVYDVRRPRGCTRCYAVHVGTFLWGFTNSAPESVAPAMRTPLAGTPSLRLEKRKLKLPKPN
jgi:hypothetical protein